MSDKPLRPCRHAGCCELVSDGYCDAHRPRGDRRGDESRAWRWMYATAKWRDELRPAQLLREPWCRECARRGLRVRATDVDHVADHKGDWARFCDEGNLESLCHSCHSRKTATEMAQNRAGNSRRKNGVAR